jgi:S1-C subfamily serine protease
VSDDHDTVVASEDDDLDGYRTPFVRFLHASKRWLALAVAAALLLPTGAWLLDELEFRRSGAGVVETLDGTLAGEEVADTILLVRTVGCTPRSGGSGSAFVVDAGDGPVVVTNRHVVEDTQRVGLRGLSGEPGPQVTGVRISDAADVAVLEVDDPSSLPPALVLGAAGPTVGQQVRLIGFPAARPFTTEGEVVDSDPSQVLLDLEVVPGASGSPVVAEDGVVVGQVFAVTRDGLGVATPADLLRTAVRAADPMPGC